MRPRPARRSLRLPAILAVTAVAALVRWAAVRELPADYDELDYIRAGERYAERLGRVRWREVVAVTENAEHPPLVKLLFGAALHRARAPEPDWTQVEIGKPVPEQARPAFQATRVVSAAGGVAQVALAAAVSPAGGLWLALDTYHAKYTSQAYLEGVAGVFALLAVLLFERSLRRKEPQGLIPEVAAPRVGSLLLSAAALGLAAASKYPYALLAGLAILPFLTWRTRQRPALRLAFAAVALAVFAAADPYLWHQPVDRLWNSVAYHFGYAVGEGVRKAGLPWWQPLAWLTSATPTAWHPGVFPVSFLDHAILVVAALSAPAALARRPVVVAWAAVGLLFLLAWPAKWPQYTVMVRPALAICIGLGASALFERVLGGRRVARV